MHLHQMSEDLQKQIEQQIKNEENENHVTEYQTILQRQKQITANLKNLGQSHTDGQESEQGSTTNDGNTESPK